MSNGRTVLDEQSHCPHIRLPRWGQVHWSVYRTRATFRFCDSSFGGRTTNANRILLAATEMGHTVHQPGDWHQTISLQSHQRNGMPVQCGHGGGLFAEKDVSRCPSERKNSYSNETKWDQLFHDFCLIWKTFFTHGLMDKWNIVISTAPPWNRTIRIWWPRILLCNFRG